MTSLSRLYQISVSDQDSQHSRDRDGQHRPSRAIYSLRPLDKLSDAILATVQAAICRNPMSVMLPWQRIVRGSLCRETTRENLESCYAVYVWSTENGIVFQELIDRALTTRQYQLVRVPGGLHWHPHLRRSKSYCCPTALSSRCACLPDCNTHLCDDTKSCPASMPTRRRLSRPPRSSPTS